MLRKPQPPSTSSDASPQKPVPPCGCDQDPVEALKQMFVDYFQGVGLAAGRDPATRPVFLRLHGAAHGTFVVNPDLPEDLRVGVFGQKSEYPAWVRFSSDVQPGRPDFKGTVGVGIKLFGVDGRKVMEPDQDATTHDFILQNHDVFFVDTAKDMCEFTCASLNGQFDQYVKDHPVTGEILDAMEKVVDTVLDTPYWSGLPSRFGEGRYVKYKLEPETVPPGSGEKPDYNDPFYLRGDLHLRLGNGESRFRFLVQFQTNDEQMPLDRATVRWSEEASPPVHVATLVLPQQDLDTRGQSTYGENLAFNTWHALPEHEPVGSIADARKVVYRASARVRRDFNGVPLGEPVEPRPGEWKPGEPYPAGKDATIVRAAIHPAIGIARVGNSRTDWFPGPEVVHPAPKEPGFYRDRSGALKRQAAIFRIYGYNAAGQVVRELTAGWADIRWTAHVANSKAAWYQWQMALDIPESATLQVPLRNAKVRGNARKTLVIDGGRKTIEGTSTQGSAYEFRGQFMDTGVYLGELRTDAAGRLIFLGGHGVSATPTGSPIYIDSDENSFINADGWYDDMSDGPVTAEVTIEGRSIPVEPAWVVTAPPNYGPGVIGVRTLYDLLVDLYIQNQWLPFPELPSFREDVYPILQRLSGLQWVNQGYLVQYGLGGPNPFENPAYIAKLGRDPNLDGVDLYGELRRQVLNSFRDPAGTDNNQLPWPWIYGDAMAVPPADTPRQNATVSPTQYAILQLWAAGTFVPDWDGEDDGEPSINKVDLQKQPATLDRAALDHCLADAFHPGCEVTWPIRHLTMYKAPFRLHHGPMGPPNPPYGSTLNQQEVLSRTGPLHAQGPGDLTRWMGLPWQADTAYCRSGYDSSYDPFVPTFWPARVPNQVLTQAAYTIAVDPAKTPEERLAAFTQRYSWVAPLRGTTAGQMEQMVRIFGDMGLLEVRKGSTDLPDLPPVMMVASFGPEIPEPPAPVAKPAAELLAAKAAPAEQPAEQLRRRAVAEAGWDSDEERKRAPLPVRHPKK